MYLTFDVGTTSVKTALYNRSGKILQKVIRSYTLDSPKVDWYEVDPEIYWQAVIEGLKEVILKSGVDPKGIKSICGCSQGETVILLDNRDQPIRPAMVWLDKRARKEVDELRSAIGEEEFFRVTGISEIDTTWSALKLLWLKKNEKDTYSRISKFFLIEDYIVYRLTGMFCSTASLLSSSALVDIYKKKYWDWMVDFLGIKGRLAPIVEEGSIVGRIKPEISSALGISREVAVVKGSMDQTMGVVGAGNIKPGIVTEITGSAMAVVTVVDKIEPSGKVPVPYQPHVIPDTYILLPFALTAGMVYKWFREQILKSGAEGTDEGGDDYEKYNRLAAAIKPGSEGLVLLPYLAGASYPENDTYAKGVFYGVTLKHGRAHFVRAIMEAIGYMLKKILTVLVENGVEIKEIRSMGGGARSDTWLQIKSDICNYPIVKMLEEEAPSLGAAVISSVKMGDYATVEDAVKAMVRTGKRFLPNPDSQKAYAVGYELYCELYRSVKPLFQRYRIDMI